MFQLKKNENSNKWEHQQMTFNNLSDIDVRHFINLYKN